MGDIQQDIVRHRVKRPVLREACTAAGVDYDAALSLLKAGDFEGLAALFAD